MKRSFADILAGLDGERARKVARKLPEWAAAGAEVPSALSLEQCSSSATARYKVSVAQAAEVAKTRYAPLASRSGQLPPETSSRAEVEVGISRPAGPGTLHVAKSERGLWPQGVTGGRAPFVDVPRVAVFSLRLSSLQLGRDSELSLHSPAASVPEAVAADVPHSLSQVIDLTGGLGVDSWALAQVAQRVVSYERDAVLAEAARRNFTRLGADNIEVRCETVNPETELPEADLIYADPARRDAAGRKVFLLEDCTPDILTLLPMLFRKAPVILLKLSPMADLTMLAQRLGPALREIHVVESDGEVKELLCLLLREDMQVSASREPLAGLEIVLASLRKCPPGASRADGNASILRFTPTDEHNAEAQYVLTITPGETLLEPSPALLKAGAFNLPCARWGLLKLAPSTHLYLLPRSPGAKPASSAPGNPLFPSPGAEKPLYAPGNPFFKVRRISEVLPFGAAAFRQIRQRWPRAEVTARNLPLGSAELQKRMGVSPGGNTHIFACRLADGSAVLLVTER